MAVKACNLMFYSTSVFNARGADDSSSHEVITPIKHEYMMQCYPVLSNLFIVYATNAVRLYTAQTVVLLYKNSFYSVVCTKAMTNK